MIQAYRIIESFASHDDKIKLSLSMDGLDEPSVPVVVIDTDDFYKWDEPSASFSYAFTKQDGPRPRAMVNGIEMFVESFVGGQVFPPMEQKLVEGGWQAVLCKSVFTITMTAAWE